MCQKTVKRTILKKVSGVRSDGQTKWYMFVYAEKINQVDNVKIFYPEKTQFVQGNTYDAYKEGEEITIAE